MIFWNFKKNAQQLKNNIFFIYLRSKNLYYNKKKIILNIENVKQNKNEYIIYEEIYVEK